MYGSSAFEGCRFRQGGIGGSKFTGVFGGFFVGEVIMILSEMFARLPEVSQSRKVMF